MSICEPLPTWAEKMALAGTAGVGLALLAGWELALVGRLNWPGAWGPGSAAHWERAWPRAFGQLPAVPAYLAGSVPWLPGDGSLSSSFTFYLDP